MASAAGIAATRRKGWREKQLTMADLGPFFRSSLGEFAAAGGLVAANLHPDREMITLIGLAIKLQMRITL